MQYFVYIGRHNKTIELFSKLSTGVFYAAPNCYKATKVLDKIREKYDAALFIEQVELSKDIADIRSIRKMYPGLYMVLVIDSITKEEATEYLKAGVNNTIKYETNSEVLKDLSTFLIRRKEQKMRSAATQNTEFKCLSLAFVEKNLRYILFRNSITFPFSSFNSNFYSHSPGEQRADYL